MLFLFIVSVNMTKLLKENIINFALLLSSLIFTFGLYYPGLFGNYVFDDPANILENSQLAITSLDYASIRAAWNSGDAGPLKRPISMLSFALNHYFTGFNPYYFKLTNLIIHLINGLLFYYLSLMLFYWLAEQYQQLKLKYVPYLAWLVCTIWLIHPLNLTSVLYVVQRMTSLSAFFGLLALLVYTLWRIRTSSIVMTGLSWLTIILALCSSLLSKESGILFILLLSWLELIIFQAKNLRGKSIYVGKIKLLYLLWFSIFLAFLYFLYLLPPYLESTNFLRRDFTLQERLLTETRVVIFYLKMFFYPLLPDLSLYHDDFIISKSLWQPITTLYSLIFLSVISLACIFFIKKHPLFLFAWGWYIISQLLESTFISLELVHEHRNYFGIMGFIFIAIYYLALTDNNKIRPFIYILGFIYTANLALTTWQRSEIWSNLVDHATYEAVTHPRSDRANYQLARIYMNLMQLQQLNNQKYFYAEHAKAALIQAQYSYKPANGTWFAILHLYSYLDEPISKQTVDELIFNLKNKPFYSSNIGFLSAFANCQINGFCKVSHDQAILIISAGLANPSVDDSIKAEIYKLLAQYYVGVISDFIKGEEFLQKAVLLHEDVNGRLLYAQIYRLQGKVREANVQLQRAQKLDVQKIWYKEIALEQRKISKVDF